MSQLARVHKALKDAGSAGVPNHKLAKICIRWHARVSDLRASGLTISCERKMLANGKPSGTFVYRLIEP